MRPLENTVALVTGGSRGIGRAICARLAADGAQIVLHYHRNRVAAEQTAAAIGGPVRLVHANVASPTEIDAMFSQLGELRLDFLVNNAGVWKNTPLGASAVPVVDEIVDSIFKGTFWITHHALPLLRDGGRIVNISSVAGQIASASGRSVYNAAKAAVNALTRNWALELAPRKILVNAVSPGYVPTDMTAAHFSDHATFQRALDRHPLGRMGTPEDIADAVAFLCSPAARFITGQNLNVSGGFVV